MATVHRPYKGKKGSPVKKATGEQIGTTTPGRVPSTTMHANSRRRQNEAREIARRGARARGQRRGG